LQELVVVGTELGRQGVVEGSALVRVAGVFGVDLKALSEPLPWAENLVVSFHLPLLDLFVEDGVGLGLPHYLVRSSSLTPMHCARSRATFSRAVFVPRSISEMKDRDTPDFLASSY
jgi:hypothetical protein